MNVSDAYTALLITTAIIYTIMLWRCCLTLYKNHLMKRTRVLMIGMSLYTFAMAHNNWARAYGRIQQHVRDIAPSQPNPEYALFAMALVTLSTLVLASVIEFVSIEARGRKR